MEGCEEGFTDVDGDAVKTIEVDLEALTAFLIDECPWVTHSDSGAEYCRKKMNEDCTVPSYMREQCPADCPRRMVSSTRCDKSQCNRIKKLIKRLKA